MKKLFTLLAALLITLGSQAKDYTDSLVVTINGTSTEMNATVALTQDADGLYTFSLKNFCIDTGDGNGAMGIGTITIDKLTAFQAGGNTMLQTARNITITDGDGIAPGGFWIGSYLGAIPINLTAKIADDKVYASIAITMASLGQTIDVTFGSGYQLPNSGFETFYNEGTSTNEMFVPATWHSFGSAKGTWSSFVSSTEHTQKSTEVRPGSTGQSSVLVYSTSVFGIVANGTITTGRMNAGSMSADDTKNHAEMDITATDKDNHGDPFYATMVGRPDSLALWVKFQQGTPNADHPYATVSAAITDGTYYQDPQDKDYTNVLATAKNNKIESNDAAWQRIVIPFDYVNEDVDGKAVLLTISTNADPGQGSNGDKLYVDDIQFIYDAAIADTTVTDGKLNLTLKGKGAFANTVYSERDGHTIATVTVYSDDLKTQTTQEFDLGESTGIAAITDPHSAIRNPQIFNAAGQRQSSLHRGLNIVRQKDGTTKKLIVR